MLCGKQPMGGLAQHLWVMLVSRMGRQCVRATASGVGALVHLPCACVPAVHRCWNLLLCTAVFCSDSLLAQVVFTDHSLFGFADAGSILLNKVGCL